MIKEDLKQFFEEHQQYMKPEIYSTAEKHDETTIISNITKRFSSVRSHEVPRKSIECHDWKSKPGKNTRGITVSMINRDLQKISLPVYFDELKKKDRLTLTADLDRVSKEYGFGPFLTSCCTMPHHVLVQQWVLKDSAITYSLRYIPDVLVILSNSSSKILLMT